MQNTWEELIQTHGPDLLAAIPMMAHALRSNDRDLQLLYCSLLDCQRDLKQASDALHTHINLNISIAREVSGHPGCQSLVRLPAHLVQRVFLFRLVAHQEDSLHVSMELGCG